MRPRNMAPHCRAFYVAKKVVFFSLFNLIAEAFGGREKKKGVAEDGSFSLCCCGMCWGGNTTQKKKKNNNKNRIHDDAAFKL